MAAAGGTGAHGVQESNQSYIYIYVWIPVEPIYRTLIETKARR